MQIILRLDLMRSYGIQRDPLSVFRIAHAQAAAISPPVGTVASHMLDQGHLAVLYDVLPTAVVNLHLVFSKGPKECW